MLSPPRLGWGLEKGNEGVRLGQTFKKLGKVVNDSKGLGVFPKQTRRKKEDYTTYINLESRNDPPPQLHML